MKVFAISDPHLSRRVDKPMDVFGTQWQGHPELMYERWRATVGEDDLVLVPGDISWAMRLSDALPDLTELEALPGYKLFTKGNHDYWWPNKRRDFQLPGFRSLRFLHGRSLQLGSLGIAATRAWKIPGDSWFKAEDRKIYDKEVRFLAEALAAITHAPRKLCMLHFPPYNDRGEGGDFLPLLEQHGVTTVVHGHLHAPDALLLPVTSRIGAIDFHLTSCDRLDFTPLLIAELEEPFEASLFEMEPS